MLKLAKTSLLAVAVMASSVVASDILATVNGKNITKQDAQAFVSASAPQANFMDLAPAEKKMVTDRLIEKVLFTELAAQEGIDKKPEFKRNMEKIKGELLVNMWMKIQMENAIVSESEAKAFYDKNAEKFMEKASMHARHILLANEKDAQDIIDILKPLKGEALKAKFIELANEKDAQKIIDILRPLHGEAFKAKIIELTNKKDVQDIIDTLKPLDGEVLKAKIIELFANNGGDLGTFTNDQVVPEFSKAVSVLKNGQMTDRPVKTPFGYHVIYLETKTEAKSAPYEKVKNNIITSLKQQQFTAKIKEVAKELRSKAKIVDMTTEVNTTRK